MSEPRSRTITLEGISVAESVHSKLVSSATQSECTVFFNHFFPLLHTLVQEAPDLNSVPNKARSCGRKRYDQLHTHQGSLCTSCLGSCNFVHIQKLLSVHYKLTKSLLLLLDGCGAFIKREPYTALPNL